MKRTVKEFKVYKWYSNQVGWLHSSYVMGYSWEDVMKRNPKYTDKHLYMVIEVKK